MKYFWLTLAYVFIGIGSPMSFGQKGQFHTLQMKTIPSQITASNIVETKPIELSFSPSAKRIFATINMPNVSQTIQYSVQYPNNDWGKWETIGIDIHTQESDQPIQTVQSQMFEITPDIRAIKARFLFSSKNIPTEKEFVLNYYEDVVESDSQETTKSISGCPCPPIFYKSRLQWSCADGVYAPLWPPAESSAKTFVIHHQAGTSNPPYDAVVRGIWNFHTYGNNWGDIGYNWLIAPDGTIYQGRAWVDDQNEEVRGAHMCSCNSNKIGICLMGDLTQSLPTQAAYQSLIALIGNKACQFEILTDTSDITPIREGTGCVDKISPTIIGHKHGCPNGYTECPGQAFSPKLNQVISDVTSYLAQCAFSTTTEEKISNVVLFPNPAHEMLNISLKGDQTIGDIQILNPLGEIIKSIRVNTSINQFNIDLTDVKQGLYFLSISTKEIRNNRIFKFIKE